MKILKASSFYPTYQSWVYARNPGLEGRGYAEQLSVLLADGFATADTWKYYLEKTGRYEVEEVIVNAEPLQKRWADERGVRYTAKNWKDEIFAEQCRVFGGDVLYALDHGLAANADRFFNKFPRRPLVVGFDGIARHDPRVVRNCDVILSCLERSVAFYRSQGKQAFFLPHGFDPRRGNNLSSVAVRSVDISFIGSLLVRIGHEERALTLRRIADELPLELWCGQMPNAGALLRTWTSYLKHGEFRSALTFFPVARAMVALRSHDRGQLFGRAMLAQMAASKVTLNIHIAAAESEAANIRLFEATGAGACLVTDWKPNISRFFEIDREVVTYRSRDEAVEKVRYLLENETTRQEVARRGAARTYRDHSVELGIVRAAEFFRQQLSVIPRATK